MNRSRGTWNNIWVISDSHLRSGENLPAYFIRRLSREDLVFHLGDFTSIDIVQYLENVASLAGVSGNCDNRDIKDIFPSRKIIELDGFTIGMIHGSGSAAKTVDAAKREFENKVDIVLFGHTHLPCSFRSGRTLFINPGSLSQGRGRGRGFGSLHLDRKPWVELHEI